MYTVALQASCHRKKKLNKYMYITKSLIRRVNLDVGLKARKQDTILVQCV